MQQPPKPPHPPKHLLPPSPAPTSDQAAPLYPKPVGPPTAQAKSSTPPEQPVHQQWTPQVYNPYAPKAETARSGPKARSPWFLIAMACLLILTGGLLVSTYFIQDQVEKRATVALTKGFAQASALGELKFSKLKFSLFRQRIHLYDVTAKLKSSGETLTIGRASIGGIDWESLKQMALTRKPVIPQTLFVQLDGIEIPSRLVGEQVHGFLKSLGYENLVVSSYIQIARDANSKTFSLEHFEVEADDLGSVDLSFSIGNLTLPTSQQLTTLKRDPKKFFTEASDLTKLTLNGFEFTFKDDSFVERATKAFTAMGESSPMALVELAIKSNSPSPFKQRDVAATKAQVDFVLPALETLKTFLKRPSSITVASRPRQAIPVFSILDDKSGGSINELAHRLSLVVE